MGTRISINLECFVGRFVAFVAYLDFCSSRLFRWFFLLCLRKVRELVGGDVGRECTVNVNFEFLHFRSYGSRYVEIAGVRAE